MHFSDLCILFGIFMPNALPDPALPEWLKALAVAMFTYAAIQKQHFTVVIHPCDVSFVYFVHQRWVTVADWLPSRGTKTNYISVSDFLS